MFSVLWLMNRLRKLFGSCILGGEGQCGCGEKFLDHIVIAQWLLMALWSVVSHGGAQGTIPGARDGMGLPACEASALSYTVS